MVYYLITCRSLTYAQKAARALERAGITAIVTRPPRGLSKEGCAYSIKVNEKKISYALVVLRSAGLNYNKVFMMQGDGSSREVNL